MSQPCGAVTRRPVASPAKQGGGNEMTVAEGAKGIILEAIKIAQELAAEDEARLGRPLTDSEVGAIATLVERQLMTALAVSR